MKIGVGMIRDRRVARSVWIGWWPEGDDGKLEDEPKDSNWGMDGRGLVVEDFDSGGLIEVLALNEVLIWWSVDRDVLLEVFEVDNLW